MAKKLFQTCPANFNKKCSLLKCSCSVGSSTKMRIFRREGVEKEARESLKSILVLRDVCNYV